MLAATFNTQDLLWRVGQLGIITEIVGALLVVYSAYRARIEFSNIKNPDSFENTGDTIEKLINSVKSQFKTELIGFSFLASGLAMQFIGAFRT